MRLSRRTIFKSILISGLIGLVATIPVILYCNHAVSKCSRFVYNDISDLPEVRAAVVFGCSKSVYGNPNQFYDARINAAVLLYESGKVKKVLVSGDNGRRTYDEPSNMKADLISRGIPERDVICDYAGFSTLDTVVRANKVFGLTAFIAVSQRFQCERAIYIGQRHNIDIVGYSATDIVGIISRKTYLREYLARVKAWLDVNILKSGPKFLGPEISV